ncbi:MAG: alkaline phosphatase D family protein [Chitinophagales bacterium]
MRALFVIILSCCTLGITAQNPEKPHLVTGPVLGSVTQHSAKLWVAYKGNGQNMLSLEDTVTKADYFPTGFSKINDNKGTTAMVVEFTGLEADRVYKVQYALDPLLPHPKCVFRTQADSAVKGMNFLFGSCALLNTGASRFIFPGFSVNIFNHMKRQHSDFMVWLGDNVYYFNKHYNSYQGMFNRNLKIRNTFPLLADFLNNQPNYAMWDDHDYGWNDADRKFPLKDTSLVVFKGFWPNPYNEADTLKGNYFTFRYYDAEFFMTDCRWYRDPEGDTAASFLGPEQVTWLENKLKASDATFKFICVGSQVLNECFYGESYAKYTVERNRLFDFIANNNIKGCIFLTGDKHYAELSKKDWKGYPLYDFTSSPLTSPILPVRYLGIYKNYCSISETILYKKNFGKISISGPAGNRVCKFELFGKGGKKKWEYFINANALVTGPHAGNN